MAPTVSIVTPVFNAASYIAAMAASVDRQTVSDWEHLLVDDSSTDNSLALCRELAAADSRRRVIARNHSGGPGVARNAGIEVAQGRYIAFIDSDDRWRPEKLEVQLEAIQRTGAVLSCTAFAVTDAQGEPTGEVITPPAHITYRRALESNPLFCSTVMYDAGIAGKCYMPHIRLRQDWGLWLQLMADHGPALGIAQTLTDYRVNPSSISRNKARAALYTWRLYRDVLGLSWPRRCYYFSRYAWHHVRHRLSARGS